MYVVCMVGMYVCYVSMYGVCMILLYACVVCALCMHFRMHGFIDILCMCVMICMYALCVSMMYMCYVRVLCALRTYVCIHVRFVCVCIWS